ncbi:hypothetical protein [Microbulbifer yueqingensis]|uniref:hypothetical protein n=1 Tax=Microbulbifer yueqingensis TaxID=658219 RepID=UPI000B80B963|nr:hypothetical protein [Microbulbifer yueqingensis]
MKISDVKNRDVFEGLEITNEVIKPVAEKWEDGLIRKTDNLQLTIKSVSNRKIKDVMAYLYYYDSQGQELGHEFDITESDPVLPDSTSRVSFMLIPPSGFSYAEISIKARFAERYQLIYTIVWLGIAAGAAYLLSLWPNA